MDDYMTCLHAFALIAWNFSPAIAAYFLIAFYAYITRSES